MKYSEYKWLSENVGSWEIRETENEWDDSIGCNDEYCKKLEHQWEAEEDCMDAFFLHECDGDCKQCNLQSNYISSYFCTDCSEYCKDTLEDYNCNWCDVGKRIGYEQIEPKHMQEIRIKLEEESRIAKEKYKQKAENENANGIRKKMQCLNYRLEQLQKL